MQNIEFKDITDEQWRTYSWSDGGSVTIAAPVKLNVSASGGHRVLDAAGQSHYIPSGWVHLTWLVKEGRPAFAF